MKRTLAIAAMVLVLVAAAAYNVRSRVATARAPSSASGSGGPPGAPGSTSAVPVTVGHVARRSMAATLALVGVLKADQEAAISARVPSRILAVLVRDGQPVRLGQPLVRLDTGDYGAQIAGAQAGVAAARAQYRKAVDGKRARAVELDAQVAQAEGGVRTALARLRQAQLGVTLTSSSAASDAERASAGVRQAEAGLRQANLGLAQAVEQLKRVQFLYQRGGVARADVEGAQTQVDVANAQRDSAVAGLEQARAAARPAAESAPLRTQVSQADVDAAKAGLRLAEDGVRSADRGRAEALRIADRDIEAARAQLEQARAGSVQAAAAVGGAILSSPLDGVAVSVTARSGEFAQPGMPLLTVLAPGRVYLEAGAPERDAYLLRPGQRARVRVDTDPGRPLAGQVSEVLPVAGADTRTVPVRVSLIGGQGRLRPGAGAQAEVDVSTSALTLAVPTDAIREEGGSAYVLVVSNGRAERRTPRLGATNGAWVQVLSGLALGDTVIIGGAASLQPGVAVQVVGR